MRGIEGMVYRRDWREEREGGKCCNYILIKNTIIKNKMVQHVKALATKLDNLTSTPGAHKEEAENQFL